VAALLFSPGLSHLSSVGFQRATRLCATPQPLITRRQEKSIQSFELDPGDFVTTHFLRTKTHAFARAYFVHQNPPIVIQKKESLNAELIKTLSQRGECKASRNFIPQLYYSILFEFIFMEREFALTLASFLRFMGFRPMTKRLSF
jgi:hypothetical protein